MKKLFVFGFLMGLLMFGCSDQSNFVEPNAQTGNSIVSSNPQGLRLIQLPEMKNGLLFKLIPVSKNIKGSEGGEIKFEFENNNGPFGEFSINANLTVPKGAFDESKTLTFTMILDDKSAVVEFGPSPMNFNETLKFDLEYRGIDLGGIDVSKVKFVYMADNGSIQQIQSDGIDVNVKDHSLKVKNAKLNHFSRFGFVL